MVYVDVPFNGLDRMCLMSDRKQYVSVNGSSSVYCQ